MSGKALADAERVALDLILEDLRYLFNKEEIRQEELDDVLQILKSDEVKSYIQSLRFGSKPETALRESFIAGKSVLLKYLFGEALPEVRSNGFIDYLIKDEMGRGIALELKPLFEADVEFDKAGKPILKRLRQKKIVPEVYLEQILKYIQEGEAKFVILTNLKDWFFYSKELSPKEAKPFCTISFFELIKEYDVIGNMIDYLERKGFESVKYELDKRFLESLKTWVKKLSDVEFIVDENRKLELIIGLINKFIFIQTLDDYGVIEFNWIKKRWNYHEQMWQRKGKLMVLEKFFNEVDDWFYLYYDTELFKEKMLPYIKKDEENIDKLYGNLQLVLGLKSDALKGIRQYNFKYIDEDVLGKAYETFLGEIRKEEGIYYTPKYITQYIAENTVGKVFDELLSEIREKLMSEEFEKVKDLVSKFISVRVLDPACGSGSFLIKAVRIIFNKYKELIQIINQCHKRYLNYKGSLDLPQENTVKAEILSSIKDMIGPNSDRELIARILVRHIHGVDLDKRALEVAKVNIWLEAIKLAPKEFRYDKLPPDTNYILPGLEMNLCNGDSVVGLPDEITINYLHGKYKPEIAKLFDLRREYLSNPMNPQLVDQISEIKSIIRKELDAAFENYLKTKGLSSDICNKTRPLHWAMEFWYLYFNESGDPLPYEERGAHVVLGNPPYERIQTLKKKLPAYVDYLNISYESAFKNYDLAVIFIEKGFKLLRKDGEFGYIVTSKFMQADYGKAIRGLLSGKKAVREIIDFGDQQVFEPEATTYTALVFLSKKEQKFIKFAYVKRLEKSLSQLMVVKNEEQYQDHTLCVFKVNTESLSKQPWTFISTNERGLFNKINMFPKLKHFRKRIFQGLVTGADPVYILEIKQDLQNLIRVYSKSQQKEYVLEKKLLKPLLKGENIKRWVPEKFNKVILFPYEIINGKAKLLDEQQLKSNFPNIWQYLLDNRNLLENRERGKWKGPYWYAYARRQNLEQFDQPKIMTQVLASKATFSLDLLGTLYFTGGGGAAGYGITLKEETALSLKFLCGLLNSSLLDWYLKKISTVYRGGFYVYARRFLEKLPIKVPHIEEDEHKLSEEIERLVDRIVLLKKCRYELIDLWNIWSVMLKNDEQTLETILNSDIKNIREGRFGETWTSKATFYLTEHTEILDKPFNDFKVLGEISDPSVSIYGLDENNKEKLVYQMGFNQRDLMLHVYYSLLQALGSKLKIKTLSQLFAKTTVPIVKEVNKSSSELTSNIINKVKDEFAEWLRQNNIVNVEADIVKVDNEIEELEAKIDAIVFKLYGLNENEIKVVFDSLKTPTIYQCKVFEFFRKL